MALTIYHRQICEVQLAADGGRHVRRGVDGALLRPLPVPDDARRHHPVAHVHGPHGRLLQQVLMVPQRGQRHDTTSDTV